MSDASSREEAGIKALTDWYADEPWRHRQDVRRVLYAADAHDRANGIHRIALDEKTVERVVDVMHDQICGCDQGEDDIGECITYDMWLETARAVLAAAVKEEQA